MCAALNLTLAPLAKRNHPAMRVERFNRFLYKVVSITTSDRGSPTVFEEAAFVASYAWNFAPIDGTAIVRSFPAIGCILRYPIDCDPSIVLPIDDPSFAITQFLAISQSTRSIATSVLSFLLDDCRTAHDERVNATRIASSFRVHDIVLLAFSNKATVPSVEFSSFSTKPRAPSVSLKIVVLAPSNFAMPINPSACCLNFMPAIFFSCPL